MNRIRGALYCCLANDHPMTVRQVFYRMVSEGVVGKTEGEYKSTVTRLLTEMRLSGSIPFGWIADNTRWQRKPRTHSSIEAALDRTARTYRRALWDSQDAYVEVWLEKDALAGVLYEVTEEWDVPLMVTRGYSSLSFLHEAAQDMAAEEKPVFLYYLGDHDPSGLDIPRNVESRLREFAPAAEIHFERIAVTEEQIADLGLPTRPTKKTDSRSRGFKGESVEVDAIPPRTLREIVQAKIEPHVDRRQLKIVMAAEKSEREILSGIANALGRGEGGAR